MRYGTKWFSSALAMAFLAVVALFVSPALAWSCCCSAGHIPSASPSSANVHGRLAAMPTHCAKPCCADDDDEAAPGVSVASGHGHGAQLAGHGAVVTKKCACSHDDVSPVASPVSASHSFFAFVALAMPVRAFGLSFEEDARFAPCFSVAARPRSPGWRSGSERGPPIFSL